MSVEIRVSIEIDGSPIPSHLVENFEKAERNIRETYGSSPPIPDLVRMWLATATSWEIRAEFERGVLSIKRGTAQPNNEGMERADAARQANPELEAKLDRFIVANPQLFEQLRAMSREELIRKLMTAKMVRAETIAHRNRELEPWLKEHPEIVAKVEQRLKNSTVGLRHLASKVANVEAQNQRRGPRISM
jgi:hypothetical protein